RAAGPIVEDPVGVEGDDDPPVPRDDAGRGRGRAAGVDPAVEGDEQRRRGERSRVVEFVERHADRIGVAAALPATGRSTSGPRGATGGPSRGTRTPARTSMRDRQRPARAGRGAFDEGWMIRTTPFHERTNAANETGLWEHWSGYLVAQKYQLAEKFEYFAIRNSAGLFDSSPLFKYRIHGPDA